MRACTEGIQWMGDRTVEEYMLTAERGDWVLWLAKKVHAPLKPLTLAKARCSKTVLHLMKDQRSISAVLIAESFGLTEEVTLYDLREAAASASSASAAASAAAAAAYAAADASDDDAYAAADAAADAAHSKNQNQNETAKICVEILGQFIIEKVNELLKDNG